MARTLLKSFIALMVMAGVALLAGCGSNSSDSVEIGASTIVVGKVTNPTSAKAGGSLIALAAGDPIDVYVEGSTPLITARVGEDGTQLTQPSRWLGTARR